MMPRPHDEGGARVVGILQRGHTVIWSEQAELSADDWLRELIEIDGLPASAREWQLITAKASTRLAGRVRASSSLTDAQIVS